MSISQKSSELSCNVAGAPQGFRTNIPDKQIPNFAERLTLVFVSATGVWNTVKTIMESLKITIMLGVLCLSLYQCNGDESTAVQYSSDTFKEAKGSKPLFVKFYAPW